MSGPTTNLRSALLTAWLLATVIPLPADAESAARFVGSAEPIGGKDCHRAANVAIVVEGRQLTFVATPGPIFRGGVLTDGLFRLLPVAQAIVEKRMLAPPVLEGRVNGDRIVGEIASRWCVYRFAAGHD